VVGGGKTGLRKLRKGRKWRRPSKNPFGFFSRPEEEPKDPRALGGECILEEGREDQNGQNKCPGCKRQR
jgi:hypothetical protein